MKNKLSNKMGQLIKHIKQDGMKDTFMWLYDYAAYKFSIQKNTQSDFSNIEIAEAELKYLTPKNKPNVFIIASIPYYDIGGGQRCSQLAKTFHIMGYNVLYVYAFKSSEHIKFDLPMPLEAHLYIEDAYDFIEQKASAGDLFLFEAPSPKFEKILDIAIAKKAKICYESIDNWETSLGSTVYDASMLKRLLTHATVLTGTAKPLVQQLNGYLEKFKIQNKPVLYSANAVDDEMFCGLKHHAKPEDLVSGKVTLLYYGSLWGEWFDWDIIFQLSQRHPEYSFNIIGDYSNIGTIRRKSPSNVHFLGLKKQSSLPAYLKHVDFAMIPFKPGLISDYVSPLKIFEYISMYSKVLCTELPDVQGYPNVYFGNTADAWERHIDANFAVDRAAADDFILDNNWKARVSDILDTVYPEKKCSALRDKVSVVILNYNNKDVIFKCVNTLLKFNTIYNCEIIVVDNASTDGSYELLCSNYTNEEIKLVRNQQNGCSSGRNLGVSLSERDYIVFLDSDQWVTNSYWLEPYEQVMQQHPNFGLIGWAAGFFDRNNKAYRVVDDYSFRYMPCNMLCRYDISYLGSGGMIVLRKTFLEAQGFDLYYDPTCYEDTDFSLKIRNLGKEIYYCPYLGVIHLPHQTTKDGSDAHRELTRKKQMYFSEKWEKENPGLFLYKK